MIRTKGFKLERLDKYTDIEKDYVYKLHRDFEREGIVWRFPNNYGASLAVNSVTHFVPELAVLKFDDFGNSELVYDTPITSDVIPNVDVGGTQSLLVEIKNLKAHQTKELPYISPFDKAHRKKEVAE